jgi:hypothetical protein
VERRTGGSVKADQRDGTHALCRLANRPGAAQDIWRPVFEVSGTRD